MAFLSWNKQYLIGEVTIDEQHQELFRLINDFHSQWLAQQDRKEIARILNQLVAYAEMHFQHEEIIMRATEYPLLETHHQEHEKMFETIFKLNRSFESGDLHLEQDTLRFIKNWLTEHIVHNDYLFRDFLVHRRAAEETAAKTTENDAAN